MIHYEAKNEISTKYIIFKGALGRKGIITLKEFFLISPTACRYSRINAIIGTCSFD